MITIIVVNMLTWHVPQIVLWCCEMRIVIPFIIYYMILLDITLYKYNLWVTSPQRRSCLCTIFAYAAQIWSYLHYGLHYR